MPAELSVGTKQLMYEGWRRYRKACDEDGGVRGFKVIRSDLADCSNELVFMPEHDKAEYHTLRVGPGSTGLYCAKCDTQFEVEANAAGS